MSKYEEKEPYGWRNRETDRSEGRIRGRLGKFKREEYEGGGGGEEKVHVVCVDDLKESRRALRFALKNVPRNHRLLLVHGNYESRIADTLTERPPIEEIRSNFLRLCNEEGVRATTTQHDTRNTQHDTHHTCVAFHAFLDSHRGPASSRASTTARTATLATRCARWPGGRAPRYPSPATNIIQIIAPMIVS